MNLVPQLNYGTKWSLKKRKTAARKVYPMLSVYYTLISDTSRILEYICHPTNDQKSAKILLASVIGVGKVFPKFLYDYCHSSAELENYRLYKVTVTQDITLENSKYIIDFMNALLALHDKLVNLRYSAQRVDLTLFKYTYKDLEIELLEYQQALLALEHAFANSSKN